MKLIKVATDLTAEARGRRERRDEILVSEMNEAQSVRLRRNAATGKLVGFLMFLMFLAMPAGSFAQGAPSWLEETMFASGKINTVLAVVLVVLVGLAAWMFAMDIKLKKLEKRVKK